MTTVHPGFKFPRIKIMVYHNQSDVYNLHLTFSLHVCGSFTWWVYSRTTTLLLFDPGLGPALAELPTTKLKQSSNHDWAPIVTSMLQCVRTA